MYLPDGLYRAVKEGGLEQSRLLQEAVRVELRRRLLDETEQYLTVRIAEVGEPGPEEAARARGIARRFARRPERAAG